MPIKKYRKTRKIRKRGGRDPRSVTEQKYVKSRRSRSPLRVGEQWRRRRQPPPPPPLPPPPPPIDEELINQNQADRFNNNFAGYVANNGMARF